MKINLKRAKDCKVQMTVEVDANTAEARFQEVLKEFRRAARLPGFREGKAPADLVEKRFAEEAREEVLKSLIPEVYHQSVHSEKVSPVSLPKISDVKYTRGQKLSFHAEFEESPNVSVKNYKGMPLKREASDVTDEELEREMRSLLESRAEFDEVLEVRPVAKGDFVVADIELWQNGAYAAGRSGVLLFVEQGQDDDFFEKVVGAEIGHTREITRKGQPYTRVTVKGIRKKRVPELTDDFAKALGQESAEALREALRKEIASYKRSESMEKMKQEVFQKLLKNTSFSLPESLVEKQTERLIEQARRRFVQMGAPEEEWKTEAESIRADMETKAKDQVKLYFILQKIAETESIDLDEMELNERLKSLVEQSGRPLEEVRRVFEEDLRESLREKKTVEFLIANAKFEEKAA